MARKPKIPSHKNAYRGMYKRTDRYLALIEQIYAVYNMEVAKLVLRTTYDGKKPFNFADFPETKQFIAKIQNALTSEMSAVICKGVSFEWNKANAFNDSFVKIMLNRYGADATSSKYARYFSNNKDALSQFLKRKDRGMGLSDKIWKIGQSYRQSLEVAISNGLETGISAVTLSKRISQYLNDFPSMKKDYTDRFGVQANIQNCEYMSARLARTEINMAYRSADQARWLQLDFVVGYEIKRSGTGYDCDLCNSLVGKYPKEFVFVGWHPNCRCYMISIMKTEDEFWAYDGKNEESTISVNGVKYVPANFNSWISNNKERISEAKSLPYFIRDNRKLIGI